MVLVLMVLYAFFCHLRLSTSFSWHAKDSGHYSVELSMRFPVSVEASRTSSVDGVGRHSALADSGRLTFAVEPNIIERSDYAIVLLSMLHSHIDHILERWWL